MKESESEVKVSPGGREYHFTGLENYQAAEEMKLGKTGKLIGIGNSMTPILKSRQPVIAEPVTPETEIEKKDIVFCKVRGNYYLHLVWAVKKEKDSMMYLIGNNHGHSNGWIRRDKIFGKVVEVLDE